MNRRTKRQNSNIFRMLGQNQIVELREAFSILDTNSDGMISREDLEEFLNSIGSPFSNEEISQMMEEMGGSFSFMTFITMIGEKLSETDNENDIRRALNEFEDVDELKKWLCSGEDGMSEEDVNILVKGCMEDGKLNVGLLTTKIKYGEIINE